MSIENTSVETTENTNTESVESTEATIEASAEDVGGDEEGAALEAAVEEDKKKSAKAYEAFMAALSTHAQALGLQLKEQKGFYQFFNPTTSHKLYVAKQGKEVTRIDTTLPESELAGISLPLEKPNGRITCHVQPSQEAVSMALDVLASFGSKIPAPKRQAKAESASK